MSDEQTIEAIKERNANRRDAIIERGEMGDYDPSLDGASQDIDVLLSEIEARDAEIERLRVMESAKDELLRRWEDALQWEKQHPSGGPPCEVCARLGPKEHRES